MNLKINKILCTTVALLSTFSLYSCGGNKKKSDKMLKSEEIAENIDKLPSLDDLISKNSSSSKSLRRKLSKATPNVSGYDSSNDLLNPTDIEYSVSWGDAYGFKTVYDEKVNAAKFLKDAITDSCYDVDTWTSALGGNGSSSKVKVSLDEETNKVSMYLCNDDADQRLISKITTFTNKNENIVIETSTYFKEHPEFIEYLYYAENEEAIFYCKNISNETLFNIDLSSDKLDIAIFFRFFDKGSITFAHDTAPNLVYIKEDDKGYFNSYDFKYLQNGSISYTYRSLYDNSKLKLFNLYEYKDDMIDGYAFECSPMILNIDSATAYYNEANLSQSGVFGDYEVIANFNGEYNPDISYKITMDDNAYLKKIQEGTYTGQIPNNALYGLLGKISFTADVSKFDSSSTLLVCIQEGLDFKDTSMINTIKDCINANSVAENLNLFGKTNYSSLTINDYNSLIENYIIPRYPLSSTLYDQMVNEK